MAPKISKKPRKSVLQTIKELYETHSKELKGNRLYSTIAKDVNKKHKVVFTPRNIRYHTTERKEESQKVEYSGKAVKSYKLLKKYFEESEMNHQFINDFVLECRLSHFLDLTGENVKDLH